MSTFKLAARSVSFHGVTDNEVQYDLTCRDENLTLFSFYEACRGIQYCYTVSFNITHISFAPAQEEGAGAGWCPVAGSGPRPGTPGEAVPGGATVHPRPRGGLPVRQVSSVRGAGRWRSYVENGGGCALGFRIGSPAIMEPGVQLGPTRRPPATNGGCLLHRRHAGRGEG
ncbi:hypothetical protein ACJJTC_005539 [Scirpophaga incertulas]